MPSRVAISACVRFKCSRHARTGDAPSTVRLITSWGISPISSRCFWTYSAYGITTKAGFPSGPLMTWMLVRAFIAFPYVFYIDDPDSAVPIEQDSVVAHPEPVAVFVVHE